MTDFTERLQSCAERVEKSLSEILTDNPQETEIERPTKLMQAMRHSSLNGGKRLRPFLVVESAALFGVSVHGAINAATALECIHCYSLVHDDLPAMDDDDLRRGQPTTHVAFDEATAILAGDALLTLAFDILSGTKTHNNAEIRIALVKLFAQSAGLGGMVGGQILDLEAENKTLDAEEITLLQSMKTGALLRCACEAGAILGGAKKPEHVALQKFGTHIGRAFQLSDDILDLTSDAKTMGKQTGKDADRGKGTLVGLYGLEKSRAMLETFLQKAHSSLESFGNEADILRETAQFIVDRKN